MKFILPAQANWRKILPVFLCIATFSLLTMYHLGYYSLWGDEAAFANVGKNIQKTGYPSIYDGKVVTSYYSKVEITDSNSKFISYSIPFLSPYLIALSTWMFGDSALAARLPFALVAIFGLIIFFILVQGIFGYEIALYAIVLQSLSVQYILYSRNAYYYSIIMFLTPVVCYFAFKVFSQNKTKWSILLFLSLLVLLYANFITCFAVIAGLFIAALFTRNGKFILKLVILLVFFCLLNIPYFLLLSENTRAFNVRAFASYGNIFYDSIALFLFYLRDISHAAFLPVLVVLLFAGTFFMFKTAVKKDYPEICSYLKYFIVFSMVVILAISATCPWPAKWAAESRANVRYVCNLLPLFMLFMAIGVFLVRQYLDRHVALVVLLILAVAPQLFSFQSRFYLLEYIREIMAPYRTNYNVVREFFRDKGEKGDFVFIAGDDIPSMVYHLRDKFRFTGLISKNLPNSAQFRNAVENYLVAGTTIPDWIISFGNPPLIFDPALHVDMINNTNEVFALVKNSRINYKMHDLRVYLRGDVVRPDIYLHGFSENKNYGPKQSTFVFERIKSHNQ